MSLKLKSTLLLLTVLTNFSKIHEISEKVNNTSEVPLLFTKVQTSITPVKHEIQKNLFNSIFYAGGAF